MPVRAVAIAAVLVLLLPCNAAMADQKIKTKSNIKNDRIANTCGQDCEAAGQAWATDNRITDPDACASPSEAFTRACRAQVEKARTPQAASD